MKLSPEVRRVIDAQRIKLAGAELPSRAEERPRLVLKQAVDESFVFGFRVVKLTAVGRRCVGRLHDDREQVKMSIAATKHEWHFDQERQSVPCLLARKYDETFVFDLAGDGQARSVAAFSRLRRDS